MSQQKVVGVVGPFGSGKTTMIQNVFGIKIQNELNGNTNEVQYYDIGKGISIADFPGSDSAWKSIQKQKDMHVPDAFIILISATNSRTGTRTTGCVDIIKAVDETEKPYLVIFTQVDRLNTCFLEDLENHKQHLIEPLLLSKNPVTFWMASFRPDRDLPPNLKICNGEDVKNWIWSIFTV